MILDDLKHKLEHFFNTWPDAALTTCLVALGMILIIIGFSVEPWQKAAVLAWCLMP